MGLGRTDVTEHSLGRTSSGEPQEEESKHCLEWKFLQWTLHFHISQHSRFEICIYPKYIYIVLLSITNTYLLVYQHQCFPDVKMCFNDLCALMTSWQPLRFILHCQSFGHLIILSFIQHIILSIKYSLWLVLCKKHFIGSLTWSLPIGRQIRCIWQGS